MGSRIALVTGANRGIGYEICRQLGQKGVCVILTSRDVEKGEAAVDKLVAEGLDIHFQTLDVTLPESVESVHKFVKREFKRLDILINNAGVYIDNRHSLLKMDYEVYETTMATNADGPLLLTQAFIPLMREHNYGRIVNVSSGIGELSDLSSSWPAYRLSKIMLNLQTRIFAQELRGSNILINAMCPGWVRTDMGGSAAPRSVEEGADTAVWLSLLPDDGPQGGFFRDRKAIDW
jgi:NAD(P)-dependent dehydrogenase (short-subunit alcohol dehydrogenase family)